MIRSLARAAVALGFELGVVDAEVAEGHFLLDQQVPPRDQHDLPRGQARQRERSAGCRSSRRGHSDASLRWRRPARRGRPGPPAPECARTCAGRSRRAAIEGAVLGGAARTGRRSSRSHRRARTPSSRYVYPSSNRSCSGSDSTFSGCRSGNGGRSLSHFEPLTENDNSSHSTVGPSTK